MTHYDRIVMTFMSVMCNNMHMASKDRVIINDYSKYKSGRSRGRVSVETTSEPLEHTFDPVKLGKGPAEAIKDAVAEEIRGITEQASANTIAQRRKAGRTGTKLFNDTGRLARGLAVKLVGSEYQTVAPKDRLTGLTGELAAELVELVDISGKDLVKDRAVRKEIQAGPGLIIRKMRKR